MVDCIQFCDYLKTESTVKLISIKNVNYRLTFHIKLVTFENIDICPIYRPKSIIFCAYIQIWANSILLITKPICIQFKKYIYICVQETSSYKKSTKSMVLCMLR